MQDLIYARDIIESVRRSMGKSDDPEILGWSDELAKACQTLQGRLDDATMVVAYYRCPSCAYHWNDRGMGEAQACPHCLTADIDPFTSASPSDLEPSVITQAQALHERQNPVDGDIGPYEVSVIRNSWGTVDIKIDQAMGPADAMMRAEEAACDHGFSDRESSYQSVSCHPYETDQ